VEDRTVPVEDLRAAGFGDEVEKVATAVAAYLDAVRDVGDTFTTDRTSPVSRSTSTG
jgi:hypothetical protein